MLKAICKLLRRKNLPKIEVYQGLDAKWRLRLRAVNGQLILGPDPYDNKGNAIRAANDFSEQLGLDFEVGLPHSPESPKLPEKL